MASNFLQNGDHIEVAAPADVTSGDGVLVGSLFGIASITALSGALVNIATKGVYELPKVSAQAWTVGARIYWDDSNKECTTTASTHKLIGIAVAAAANPSDTGNVRLSGAFTL